MITILDISFKLTLWFLLTSDLSWANIAIGVAIALLLPKATSSRSTWRDWVRVIQETLMAIPQAYMEAFEMIFRPHLYEEITMEQVKPNRSSALIFLDIFLITFTPKTIVLHYHEDGWYEVHRVVRRKSS